MPEQIGERGWAERRTSSVFAGGSAAVPGDKQLPAAHIEGDLRRFGEQGSSKDFATVQMMWPAVRAELCPFLLRDPMRMKKRYPGHCDSNRVQFQGQFFPASPPV